MRQNFRSHTPAATSKEKHEKQNLSYLKEAKHNILNMQDSAVASSLCFRVALLTSGMLQMSKCLPNMHTPGLRTEKQAGTKPCCR